MKTTLSIRAANLLFLITMALVALLGSFVQSWNLGIGLIATEIFLILLPAIVLLRANHIPFREGLKLHPIRPATAVISLLLGISVFLFTILIEVIMMQLTGSKPVPVSESTFQNSVFDTVLFAVGLAFFAPFCEEILFRGAIQSAYLSHKSVRFGITLTALMFAFYHFRLSGLPALLPVAFILGYVAWRTNSIYASILVHFGMNGTSAVHSLIAIYVNGTGLPLGSIWVPVGGLLAASLLIFVIRRLNPAPETILPAPLPMAETPSHRWAWLGAYWPLFVAGLLYLGIAGLSLASMLSPENRASSNYEYFKPSIARETTSRYQIIDRAEDVVGEMQCKLSPSFTSIQLDCSASIRDYEVQLTSSFFKDQAHTSTWSVTWDANTMDLLDYTLDVRYADGSGYQSTWKNGQLTTTSPEQTDGIELPESALLAYEWPWRADMLQTNAGDIWKIPFGAPHHWDDSLQRSIPMVQSEILQVSDDQSLSLPAGEMTVRSFTFAGQAAWYAQADPAFPRPVQFDDGMLTYQLVE